MVWIQRVAPRPLAARRVVCFPHAGGSPYFFQQWGRALDGFEVYAVCYPGRAERMAEPPAGQLVPMARDIAREAARSMAGDGRPTVFFGHSMARSSPTRRPPPWHTKASRSTTSSPPAPGPRI